VRDAVLYETGKIEAALKVCYRAMRTCFLIVGVRARACVCVQTDALQPADVEREWAARDVRPGGNCRG
jgi:hypothetical protein